MPLSYVMQEVRDSDGHQENYYQTRTGYSGGWWTFWWKGIEGQIFYTNTVTAGC